MFRIRRGNQSGQQSRFWQCRRSQVCRHRPANKCQCDKQGVGVRRSSTYSILVAVETGIVEPSISVADAQSESWICGCVLFSQSNAHAQFGKSSIQYVTKKSHKLTVRREIIDHIQIIRSEIRTSKRRIVWHSKTSRTASSE